MIILTEEEAKIAKALNIDALFITEGLMESSSPIVSSPPKKKGKYGINSSTKISDIC